MAEQVSGRLAIYDLDRSEVVAIRLHRETTPIAAPYRSRHYDGEQLLGRDTFRRQWKWKPKDLEPLSLPVGATAPASWRIWPELSVRGNHLQRA